MENELKISLCGVLIDNLSLEETSDLILKHVLLKNKSCDYVVTPNAQHIVYLQKDIQFRNAYKDAFLRVADGVPLVWLSKLKKTPLKSRVNGTDLFVLLCKRAKEFGVSVFLLGGRPGVAEKCSNMMSLNYGTNVVGTYFPPFGFEKDKEECQKIINIVNDCKPDIVFLGLGSPKQELFTSKFKNDLNCSIAVCIGASFELVTGVVKRAPLWMQKTGLEWFYRLSREPKRLLYRYTILNINFIYYALGDYLSSIKK